MRGGRIEGQGLEHNLCTCQRHVGIGDISARKVESEGSGEREENGEERERGKERGRERKGRESESERESERGGGREREREETVPWPVQASRPCQAATAASEITVSRCPAPRLSSAIYSGSGPRDPIGGGLGVDWRRGAAAARRQRILGGPEGRWKDEGGGSARL